MTCRKNSIMHAFGSPPVCSQSLCLYFPGSFWEWMQLVDNKAITRPSENDNTPQRIDQRMNSLLQLSPQVGNCINFRWTDFLAHGQAYMGQIGRTLWHSTTTGIDNSTGLQVAKIHPVVYETCIFNPWEIPYRQMGKWPWCCTVTCLDNSIELSNKINPSSHFRDMQLAHR